MLTRSTLSVVAVVAVASAGCYDPKDPKLPPVEPAYPDEVVTVYAEDSAEAAASPCGRACVRLRDLGCPEGAPSASGVSCYRVCVHASQLKSLRPSCVASASSVDAVRACGTVRCSR